MTHKDASIIFIRYLGFYLLFRSLMTIIILINNLVVYGFGNDLVSPEQVRSLATGSVVSVISQLIIGLLVIKKSAVLVDRFIKREQNKELNISLDKNTLQETVIFGFGLYLLVSIIPSFTQIMSGIIETGSFNYILPFFGQVFIGLILTLHRHKISRFFNKFREEK